MRLIIINFSYLLLNNFFSFNHFLDHFSFFFLFCASFIIFFFLFFYINGGNSRTEIECGKKARDIKLKVKSRVVWKVSGALSWKDLSRRVGNIYRLSLKISCWSFPLTIVFLSWFKLLSRSSVSHSFISPFFFLLTSPVVSFCLFICFLFRLFWRLCFCLWF